MEVSCGDFVILRSDAFFAYQLAVTVDDLEQGVTEVVRGADLIGSTSKQVYLAKLLHPKRGKINYLHAPLMVDDQGRRMSKRDGSISAEKWRIGGGSSEQLLAHLVVTIGLIEEPLKSIAIDELVERVDDKLIAGKLSSRY
jgi:glutamyl-tRNA synthetase